MQLRGMGRIIESLAQRSSVRTMWLMLLCSTAVAQLVAAQPLIGAGKEQSGGETAASLAAKLVTDDSRTVLEAYRSSGNRSEDLDDEIIDFLESHIRLVHRHADAPEIDTHVRNAAALAECDDPMVKFAIGYAYFTSENHQTAESFLQDAVKKLPGSAYPHRAYAEALACLAKIGDAAYESDRLPQIYSDLVDALMETARRVPRTKHQLRGLTHLLCVVSESLPDDQAERLALGLMDATDLDICMRRTVMGAYEIRCAWKRRGNGVASTVMPEGWQGFAEHLNAAREHLETAYQIDPSRPEAASLMISVSMAGHASPDDSEWTWFDRATASQIDFADAYQRVRSALLPRWGGSHQQMYDFAMSCYRSKRFDTTVPYQFVTTMAAIVDDMGGSFTLMRDRSVYPLIAEIIDQMAVESVHKRRMTQYRTTQMIFAWGLGEYAEARRLMDALGDRMRDIAFRNFKLRSHVVKQDIIAYSSEFAERIRTADRALHAKQFETSIAEFKAMYEASNDHELRCVLRDRLVTATWQRDFEAGQWVTLTFETNLPGWSEHGGVWHPANESTVMGGLSGNGFIFLVNNLQVGNRFELKGSMDTTKGGSLQARTASIAFRFADNGIHPDWYAFLLWSTNNVNRARIGYRAHPDYSAFVEFRSSSTKRYDFHMQLWDNQLNLIVNEQQIHSGPLPTRAGARLGECFALGAQAWRPNGYTTYENLQLRKLNERPAGQTP